MINSQLKLLFRLRYETNIQNKLCTTPISEQKRKELLISLTKYKHLKMRIAQLHSFWAKNNEK